ncbi:MAG: hypothetical protein QXG65_01450 [Thermoplasmata archaeon]
MLRENAFWIGGGVMIALGIALVAGLWWAGAGWLEYPAYMGAALSVAFGAFFLAIARAEGRERRRELARIESGSPSRRPPA